MKLIEMDLSDASLEAAMRALDRYKARMEERMRNLTERLALVGAMAMRLTYTNALYAGLNDVEVTVDFPDDKTAVITAQGQAVAFIEFGTGINYPEGEYATLFEVDEHGSYGKGYGGTGKRWFYRGVPGNTGLPAKGKPGVYRTDGNSPANAFPAADKAMRDRISQIVQEVFRD